MIDFMKVITSGDTSELSKVLTHFVERAIAAVLVFLIPTFISIIFFIAGAEEEYKRCFEKPDLDANIKIAYIENK